jgi:lipoprotein-releasing system permease protein
LDTSLFIAGRIAGNRQRSFSRFIIRLAVVATALSVATMILSLAFVNGFQKVIADKIFSFWGHIRVQRLEAYKVNVAEETPMDRNDTVQKQVASLPYVADMQAFATKSAVLNANGNIEGVLFKGVEPGYRFPTLLSFLKKGRWLLPDSGSRNREIVLSETVAQELRLDVGDDLLVYFIRPDEPRPRTRKLRVCGLFRTGIDIYDKTFAYGDLSLVQRLNGWGPGQIGGYEVVLSDPGVMDYLSNMIYDGLPQGWDSKTLRDIHPEIFDWLDLQDTNKYILLTVMTVVAAINLITCLIILVLERTRMVGVLKSLGMSDWGIQKIFLAHGAVIMARGIGIGTALGLAICLLQLKTGFIRLDEQAYYMDRAPVELVWWQVGAVILGTFAVCMAVLLVPSMISRRVQPAKAVQFR